ncbi:MAG: hypothetical protein KA103_02655 [Saprospiraceae bacterium]|nr:hypothetical protein [Saprospiraceae bacterium]
MKKTIFLTVLSTMLFLIAISESYAQNLRTPELKAKRNASRIADTAKSKKANTEAPLPTLQDYQNQEAIVSELKNEAQTDAGRLHYDREAEKLTKIYQQLVKSGLIVVESKQAASMTEN